MSDKYFTFTKEKLHSIFCYENGNLFWKSHKYKAYIGKKAGTLNPNGYIYISINSKQYFAHRLIFLMNHGYLPKTIDHINNNKSDNRIENLRPATISENGLNRKTSKNNSSGVKNVAWCKSSKKWKVSMTVNGKDKYFGVYDNLELADLVAQEARDKFHGKFARHK